jgi:hypothetical protein
MIAEWFAYIADILTFYNERIANADYLGTAELPESVAHLIALLGYRPRPAIGATGYLAALVTAGQSAVLPKGLQSKPAPGQEPQTFAGPDAGGPGGHHGAGDGRAVAAAGAANGLRSRATAWPNCGACSPSTGVPMSVSVNGSGVVPVIASVAR